LLVGAIGVASSMGGDFEFSRDHRRPVFQRACGSRQFRNAAALCEDCDGILSDEHQLPGRKWARAAAYSGSRSAVRRRWYFIPRFPGTNWGYPGSFIGLRHNHKHIELTSAAQSQFAENAKAHIRRSAVGLRRSAFCLFIFEIYIAKWGKNILDSST
jgi:hypothetical protein